VTLVDSHCHLDFPDFADELDDVVGRAHRAGVTVMQTICTRMTKFDQVLALARRYDDIYCSVGIHPHNVADEPAIEAADLVARSADDKVIGIGETGLDYHYDHSPRDAQRACFRSHIAAARETGLPVIVHTRNADQDTADILADEMGQGAFSGLIHCFSTSRELAERALAMGLYISISGIATFKAAGELRDIVRDVPLDRLLVETDAPYLAPMPKRGKRNEPAFVVHTAERVAEVKGITPEALAAATTANFFELFTKAQAKDAPCA
jgi:TatD DNase family protein